MWPDILINGTVKCKEIGGFSFHLFDGKGILIVSDCSTMLLKFHIGTAGGAFQKMKEAFHLTRKVNASYSIGIQ